MTNNSRSATTIAAAKSGAVKQATATGANSSPLADTLGALPATTTTTTTTSDMAEAETSKQQVELLASELVASLLAEQVRNFELNKANFKPIEGIEVAPLEPKSQQQVDDKSKQQQQDAGSELSWCSSSFLATSSDVSLSPSEQQDNNSKMPPQETDAASDTSDTSETSDTSDYCNESVSAHNLRQLRLIARQDLLVCEQNRHSILEAKRLFNRLASANTTTTTSTSTKANSVYCSAGRCGSKSWYSSGSCQSSSGASNSSNYSDGQYQDELLLLGNKLAPGSLDSGRCSRTLVCSLNAAPAAAANSNR